MTTKIKVSFTEKKELLYFKESFTFLSKCCILKKVLITQKVLFI